jgi:uncharacterized cysteine cluster protein YcgN (CxxCxxCC family)
VTCLAHACGVQACDQYNETLRLMVELIELFADAVASLKTLPARCPIFLVIDDPKQHLAAVSRNR